MRPLGLAYVHVIEGETGGSRTSLPFDYARLRELYEGVWMVNNGYDRAMAMDAVTSGRADLVSFGRLYIANPDLVERLSRDAPLNKLMDRQNLLRRRGAWLHRLSHAQTKRVGREGS